METIRKSLVDLLTAKLGIGVDVIDSSLHVEDVDLKKGKKVAKGDVSLHVFDIAKSRGENPVVVAKSIADVVGCNDLVASVKSVGPYVNFNLNKDVVINTVLGEVDAANASYGGCNVGSNQTVVLDYSAPNLGKPLHVGHIRSTILGDTLQKVLNFAGFKTHGINYLGDVGLHIGKIMHAYKTWGDEAKIRANPEAEILNLYVGFCKAEEEHPELSEAAKKEIDKIERKDAESLRILDFIHQMSMAAFNRVYDMLNVKIDEVTGQSKFSDKGKSLVQKALADGFVDRKDDGALCVNLDKYTLPEKIVLRSDGTAIYSTQDIGAAVTRFEEHKFSKLVYVVGSEQDLYFRQLFAALDKMGYSWAKDCFHVSFGMINLAEGKMSTREGSVVLLEEVLQKAIQKATDVIDAKSSNLPNKSDVAHKLGIGAMKYLILSVDYSKDIEFDWGRALNIEGNSATYIMYTYARANSLTDRLSDVEPQIVSAHLDSDAEYNLVRKIGLFPSAVKSAALKLKPHIVANYVNDLCTAFNVFYTQVKVKDSGEKIPGKLALVDSFKTTVENACSLLGISLPDRL